VIDKAKYPRVVFSHDLTERTAAEMSFKGWVSASVELANGCRYPVYFVDPVRLQQDLAEYVRLGRPCFAEPGLIVLPQVTMEAIDEAAQFLWKEGFFDQMRPDQSVE
jgi:hypothetical protein